MNQLTTQQRLQVFMLYPNAEILYDGYSWRLYALTKRVSVLLHRDVGLSATSDNINDCQLLLRDIADITQDELLEIASFVYSDPTETEANLAYDYISYCFFEEQVSKHTESLIYLFRDEHVCLQTTDYLRSKNYALPYMGIDLFESGIAKRIE